MVFHKGEVSLAVVMCSTYAVMFIGNSPTFISDLITHS